jgi:hypothetical protein
MSKITTKAYFDADIKPKIIELLQTAKSEVFVASAWFNDNELYDALLSLPRTVKVKVLIKKDEERNTLDWMNLGDCGIKVYQLIKESEGRSLMHNKFCVIDNETVITGSYNWTNGANYNNYENIVVIQNDDELCEQYIAQFNDLIKTIANELQEQLGNLLAQRDIYIQKVEMLMTWIADYIEKYNKFPSNQLIKAESEKNGSITPMIITADVIPSDSISYENQPIPNKSPEPFYVQDMSDDEIKKWWKEELSRDLKSFFVRTYFNEEYGRFEPDTEGLKNLLSIENLNIINRKITSIAGISKMKNLKEILCSGNPRLTNFKEIENLDLLSMYCDIQIEKFPVEVQRFRNIGLSLINRNTATLYWKKEILEVQQQIEETTES